LVFDASTKEENVASESYLKQQFVSTKIDEEPADQQKIRRTKEKTRKINIAKVSKEPEYVEIGDFWDDKTMVKAILLFQEFVEVFTYEHHDLKVFQRNMGN
jgi:hypothetical protein